MVEKINKLIENLKIQYPGHSLDIIQNDIKDNGISHNILLIKDSNIVKIYEVGIDGKLEYVDLTRNMLGLINNIRRKNLCVQ